MAERRGETPSKRSKASAGPVVLTSPWSGERKEVSPRVLAGSCRKVAEFERLNRLGEGTFGVVYRARDTRSEEIVAVKQIKLRHESEGLPLTSWREIAALSAIRHENVVALTSVAVGRDLSNVFLVMEYCDHDLGTLLDNLPAPFPEGAVKGMTLQLLQGLQHLHSRFIIHRDLKLSNILLTDKGALKICDFGLARCFSDPPGDYSPRVVTLWYRSPELLFGADTYATAVDMWSVGCILAELIHHEPLFPGATEVAVVDMMVELLGTPSEVIWPGFNRLRLSGAFKLREQPYNNLKEKFGYLARSGIDLLNGLLMYEPSRRIGAVAALRHPYFSDRPIPSAYAHIPHQV